MAVRTLSTDFSAATSRAQFNFKAFFPQVIIQLSMPTDYTFMKSGLLSSSDQQQQDLDFMRRITALVKTLMEDAVVSGAQAAWAALASRPL